ncbi:MAG: SAM-dependent methyltransferase [Anaerolineae bacterium]|nr:SAM-dependent methyltransferase [Anaerolineae bacterium]
MPAKTIVDASVPNAGRVYDYLLGGHHNFEIDRQAGDRVKALMPTLPKLMRLFRWCLQDIAHELTTVRGYDAIVDFASGLPTADHLHTNAAPDTTLIYSDRDPVCVEYGREILGLTPNIHYFQADCRYPKQFLGRPEIQALLKGKRVAYVYWGISMYLSNDDIRVIANELYEVCDPDATLAFYIQPGDDSSSTAADVVETYRRMGETLYFHDQPEFAELIKPWVADSLGYRTMEAWHGVNSPISTEDAVFFPGGTTGIGVYLVKGK